ncbi:MAG: glycosyltransferase family 9 protein [Gallionella sp.]
MNIKFQRTVDHYLGVPICALLSLFEKFRGKSVMVSPPRRILVILLSEMGSLVLAHPMFQRLKQLYPDAEMHVLLFAKNREVLDLLDVVPKANVHTLNDGSLTGLVGDSLKAIRTLRRVGMDAVIDCELFSRVSSIFSYLSGAPLRVGFHPYTQEGLYRGSFINRPVLYNTYRHLSHQFLTMVAALESSTVPVAKIQPAVSSCKPPALNFADHELEQAAAQLHKQFPMVNDRPLILVYPSGGILPIRAWPIESYISVCRSLVDEGYAIGVIGLKGDRQVAQLVVDKCESSLCINLAGYTKTVRELLALFHRASLLITNDGGPGQFAALTPLPTITFFGPETPQLYQPLGSNGYSFFLSLPCSPCLTAYNHRNSPCDGDNQCLKQISPSQVLAKSREMLSGEYCAQNRRTQ